jgi:hypothetical protein
VIGRLRAAAPFLLAGLALAGLTGGLTAGLTGCGGSATPVPVAYGAAVVGWSGQTAAFSANGDTLQIAGRTTRVAANDHTGAFVAGEGRLSLDRMTFFLTGTGCAGLATAAQGGAITAQSCEVVTSGHYSPCLYSRDTIAVTGGTYEAIRSEAARVEPGGSVTVTGAALSSKYKQCAVRLAPAPHVADAAGSAAGGAAAGSGAASFSMSGGSLVYADKGPLFRVEGCTGVINLSGVAITDLSDFVLKAEDVGTGSTVKTGATVTFTAQSEKLIGDIKADPASTISVTLSSRSVLNGSIDCKNDARRIDLSLQTGSTWRVTEDSYLSGLSLEAGAIAGDTVTSILGDGHTVFYDPDSSLSAALAGKTYRLAHGGSLVPRAPVAPATSPD